MTNVTLHGRIFISGNIRAVSGLRVGGAAGSLSIGGVDLPVIRGAADGKPYIPGSSLKGKMRSLAEKLTGAPQNREINRGRDGGAGRVAMHVAETPEDYDRYWVNPIFGVMGDAGGWMTAPNRLIVRDVPLDPQSAKDLEAAKTDLPYTEVKWEAAIDRVTSAATPRQIERVPAGAIFSPMELIFNVYLPGDFDLFAHVITALQLVEDDYLGGHGSRGSGKVAFEKLSITCKSGADYAVSTIKTDATLSEIKSDGDMLAALRKHIKVS